MPGGLWEDYFWPGTQVLRNTLGVHDQEALSRVEYGLASGREREIDRGEADIARTFDAAHLRAIHRQLFRDVYAWAGEYRTVDISKGVSEFAAVEAIDRYLADAHQVVARTSWAELDRDGFARAVAEVYAYVNQAHPFRKGNGRAAKVFLQHVAERSRFFLDFERVSSVEWNTAAALSGPDRGSYEPVPDLLVPVFGQLAEPRDQPTGEPGDPDVARAGEASRAMFPRPAQEAAGGPADQPERYRPDPAEGYRSPYRSEGPQL